MKKIVALLVMLLIASPTLASVNVTCATGDSASADCNLVTVSYSVSDETYRVRAFALDITVDNGAVISDVTAAKTGESTSSSKGYGIFPGTISITGSSVDNYGTPVADPCDDPDGTEAGEGTDGITVELGSLYEGVNYPDSSGDLLSFRVDANCTVTVALNASRGGIVMEEPSASASSTSLTGCDVLCGAPPEGCTYTGPEPDQWAAVGEPNCWCASDSPRQCHGDADKFAPDGKKIYWVTNNDLTILLAAWNKLFADINGLTAGQGGANGPNGVPLICADFDHVPLDGKQPYRVTNPDLTILLDNWNTEGVEPNCP
jgi:hypothetical protein